MSDTHKESWGAAPIIEVEDRHHLAGGFVAGTHAGLTYNTFPLMGDYVVPPEIFLMQPWWKNFFYNMATVQFDHRLLAWVLAFAVPLLWWKLRRAHGVPHRAGANAHLLLVLLALRVALLWVPGRAFWGYDLARDLDPVTFWLPLVFTLVSFVPAVADAGARALQARGAPALTAMLGGLALAGFLWTHPDRALYNGDTSLRHGAFAETANPEKFAEQALRGDLVLHHAVPRAMAAALGTNTEVANRLWGVFAALASVLGAWLLARTLGGRGSARITALVLALSTGAPIVFGTCVRASDGRYDVAIDPPYVAAGEASDPEAVRALTAWHTARLERSVRARPESWFWLHKRWKTAPPSDTSSEKES